MVESRPIGISTVAYVLGMNSGKLQRWYRNVLSGYLEASESGKLFENDIEDKDYYIPVPILKPDNMGSHMAIDEKYIDGEYYTILSNKETGKIAMLAQTTKSSHIAEILSTCGDKCMNVKTISRDLAPHYDMVCRENFMNAIAVADKFHIIKIVLQAVQDQRIEYRHLVKAYENKLYEEHQEREKRNQIKARLQGKKYKKEKYTYRAQKYANGETKLQILQRSRGLLFKPKTKWHTSMKIRAEILFELFPELEKLYNLSETFRRWMSKSNIGKSRTLMGKRIKNWFGEIDHLDNFYMNQVKITINKHLGVIMNYFYEGTTNAFAENLNRHIKRFIASLFGIREMDFFFFRLAIYFS